MTDRPTVSVLIPSFRRPDRLTLCLEALARQTVRPDQVVVVWQADDTPTRDAAARSAPALPFRLDVLHAPVAASVPAVNRALVDAVGSVVVLTDDDAEAPPDWLGRHLRFFADPAVGAVGGPADNHLPDGTPYPRRAAEPCGRVRWYGRLLGNMQDQPVEWRTRPPIPVDHLIGANVAVRRVAFDRLEDGLRPPWQGVEADLCGQVAARGYRVMFDYGNVVDHHPTGTTYTAGRAGDLRRSVENPAFNLAFVLAKHTRPEWLRLARVGYLLAVGSVQTPGLLTAVVGWRRFGDWRREGRLLLRTWAAVRAGWRAGTAKRGRTSP